MVVALADSFFFDVDPSGARSKVLAFLLVSFTPFLVVAPFIGPVIDRVFPASDAPDAHRWMESNEGFGKILLRW